MASTSYDDHGIRFDYPEGWELEEEHEDGVLTVSVHAPDGLAFAMMTVDASRPDPQEVAEEALEAMREEYPTLDAQPAFETIAGHPTIGHDVEFISLDIPNACTIRTLQTARMTALIFGQWSDLEDEATRDQLAAVRSSFRETDD